MIKPTPSVPISKPIIKKEISPSIIESAISTIPIDGNVSRNENGGAICTAIARPSTVSPIKVRKKALSKRYAFLGRENFSSQRIRRTINGIAFVRNELFRGILFILFGNHSALLPNTIWSDAIIVPGINTNVVIPPVGIGNDGININTRKRTAKLRSSKKSSKSPTVFD
ncbi:MAG: hypothetical protein QG628_969 [Patescibacteria group bacterium]|nr:hypothetical protein [Patescibacteria group bacterium]